LREEHAAMKICHVRNDFVVFEGEERGKRSSVFVCKGICMVSSELLLHAESTGRD